MFAVEFAGVKAESKYTIPIAVCGERARQDCDWVVGANRMPCDLLASSVCLDAERFSGLGQ